MIDFSRMNRRAALRALGASIALPFLDSLAARIALAAPPPPPGPARPPVRVAFLFFPNGAVMSDFTPMPGATALPPTLAPLEALKAHFLILSGLALDGARAKNDGPGDHARSSAAFLTATHPLKSEGKIRLGVSADQLAARVLGEKTPLPSLEVGCDRGKSAGQCDSGYSCAYQANISWSSETTPVPKEVDPRAVFERLFGAPGDEPAVGARRLRDRRSVLDVVQDDARRLEKELGAADRQKLDEFATSLREVERRIENAEKESREHPRPDMAAPAGVPHDYQEHVRLLYDLTALAFQTDTTRVVSFMLGDEGSDRSYHGIGVAEGHHQLSHHGGDKGMIEKVKKIDRFQAEQFAYFLKKLAATKEGKGSLLDSSMIVYGGGISDGNKHEHENLPILLAGRGGGSIAPGRHVAYPKNTPLANLYVAMLQRAGVRGVERFGDSTGALGQLS